MEISKVDGLEHLGLIGTSEVLKDTIERIEISKRQNSRTLIISEAGFSRDELAKFILKGKDFITIDGHDYFESKHMLKFDTDFCGGQTLDKPLLSRNHPDFDSHQFLKSNIHIRYIDLLNIGTQYDLKHMLDHDKSYRLKIVATALRGIERDVEKSKFCPGLYYNFPLKIEIPRLKDRLDDLEVIAPTLLKTVDEGRFKERQFSKAGIDALKTYDWPGNMFELESVIKYCAYLSDPSKEISVKMIEKEIEGKFREKHLEYSI